MNLIVVPNFKTGGSERILKMYIDYCKLNSINYDLVFISSYGNNNFWKGYKYKIISDINYLGYFFLPFFLFNKKYNISFTSNIYLNSILSILRKCKIFDVNKILIRESTNYYKRFKGFQLLKYSFFHKIGYKYSDTVIFQTNEMKSYFDKNLQLLNPLKIVLPNPIEKDKIKSMSELQTDIIEKEYFICLGRLIYDKGFDILINAYSKCESLPDLYIFGSGIEYNNLKKLITNNKLSNKIFIKDEIINPFPLIKSAKGCILPSRNEGFPNVLNEMILLNKNILSTKCVEDISKMSWILTCEPNDENSMITMLKKLNSNFQLTTIQETKRSNYIKNLSYSSYFDKFKTIQ